MTHEQFEIKMREMGALINVPEEEYPWVGRCNYDGVYVEIDKPISIYRWVSMERGCELNSRIFRCAQDLLYCVFERITGNMAFSYEALNRIPSQSPRRLAFEHQLYLLGKIDVGFKEKREEEIKELLAKFPYCDQR